MGSATREALVSSRAALAALGSSVDLATGESLFTAGRIVGDSSQLRSALADSSSPVAARVALVGRVFSSALTPSAVEVLKAVASARWSSQSELLAGIEELGLRATAASAPRNVSIEAELFSFASAVSSDAGLELALTSKLGRTESKLELVDALLEGRVSAHTLAIVRHLVRQPRGRRIGQLLRHAASVVADQAGTSIATVTTASRLSPEQLERLTRTLAARYGRELTINQVVDGTLVGGVRVQIGDDVIDGSIATRIKDLRLQLAG